MPNGEGLLEGQFRRELEGSLPTLLEPLLQVRDIPSDTIEHVKFKGRIYKNRLLPAIRRFALVADLWVAESVRGGVVRWEQYKEALESLGKDRHIQKILHSSWSQSALSALVERAVVPFHWELVYPLVFLSEAEGGDPTSGFDVILGNPPYDVLSEQESGKPIDHIKRFIKLDPTLESTFGGKNNLYKLFIARSTELLRDGGLLSFIVPMALLGDKQAKALRRMLFSCGEFSEIHAFPQKDSVANRVFADAKLATTLFVYRKKSQFSDIKRQFPLRVHSGRTIEASSSVLRTDSKSIGVYDPENFTIVSCTQEDWDLLASLPDSQTPRLGDFAMFFQGEVNQTTASKKGWLTTPSQGQLTVRGASVSLYQLREASQGQDIYLDVEAFLRGRDRTSKAFHHQHERIALQESSPQNNFRRIIACRVPEGRFCNHTINYTTSYHCKIDLSLVLFVLNSAFADWYFRLGSTNAHVNQYQLDNIPCPQFGSSITPVDDVAINQVDRWLELLDFSMVEEACVDRAREYGLTTTLEQIIVKLVQFIESGERQRGRIARTRRSSLSRDGNCCQVILDKILFALLGFGVDKYEYIAARLPKML